MFFLYTTTLPRAAAAPPPLRRVGPALARRASHRSVRAQFGHTARPVKDSLRDGCHALIAREAPEDGHYLPIVGPCFTSSAIRCRFVDTVIRFEAPAVLSGRALVRRL
jgi:hypothetical protein